MADKDHMHPPDVTCDPKAEERLEHTYPVVHVPEPVERGMLPGVAGICMFLLLVTMLNAFGAIRGAFGSGTAKYGVLALCTLLATGIFGLLKLRRWGWALVTVGCLLMSVGDMLFFTKMHVAFFLVRSALEMVFFLYLSRAEVRQRLG